MDSKKSVPSKIIGFTLSSFPISHDDIDPFNSNLTLVVQRPLGLYLYLWGIGDIAPLINDFTYSLGFPPSLDRFDRNILIHITQDKITIENDWLGSIPIFYNKDTRVFSTLPIKTLTGDDDVDPIGIYLFLETGHNILNRTMFQRVRMLRYYSRITVYKNYYEVATETLPFIFESMDNASSGSEQDAVEGIERYFEKATQAFAFNTKVALNLNNQLSNRLLLAYFPAKHNLQTFAYDFQGNNASYDIVKAAQKISEALNVSYRTIHVDEMNSHLQQWFQLFGFSTNFHGSWQIENFRQFRMEMQKLSDFTKNEYVYLSSTLGDAWGGGYDIPLIQKSHELKHLTVQSELKIPSPKIIIPPPEHIKSRFLSECKTILSYPEGRILTAIRVNMARIAYFFSLPEYFGFPVLAPFLNRDVVHRIFSIPLSQRKKSRWIKDLFRRLDLYSEDKFIAATSSRHFILNVTQSCSPLNAKILGYCVPFWFVRKINNLLFGNEFWSYLLWKITDSTRMTSILWKFGMEKHILNCLNCYQVLKPIEMSIEYAQNLPPLDLEKISSR